MKDAYLLSGAEFGNELGAARHTLFRLELQDRYSEPCETELVTAWQNGSPFPAPEVPELAAWYQQVAGQVRRGIRVERVRVQQEPPTTYQRLERWLDQWNLAAGETMRYLTAAKAHDIGLLPAAGNRDWWLIDSARLIVMTFDEAGHRIRNELTTDPATVLQACKWRDLAVHHSTEAKLSDVAA